MNNSKRRSGLFLFHLLAYSFNNTLFAQDSIKVKQDSIFEESTSKVNCLETSIRDLSNSLNESIHHNLISGFPDIYLILILCGIAILFSLYAIYKAHTNYAYSHSDMDCDNSFSFNELKKDYTKIEDEFVQLKNRIHALESQLSNSRKVQSNSTTGGVKKNAFREQGTNSMLPNTVKPKDNNDKVANRQAETREYIWLKAVDGGKLSIAQSADVAMYRAWKSNDIYAFEFCCAKTGKAINNRTSVIDPFCEVQTNGIDPDQAKSVNVKKPGSLSSDFQVLTKVIIQYC